MSWAQDLAVEDSGNTYVLGRNISGNGFGIFKFSPAGVLPVTFEQNQLFAPGRLALTSSGRIVVSKICKQPTCISALYVFFPEGSVERTVDLPRGPVTQVIYFGGEVVGLASFDDDPSFRFDFRKVDVSTGAVLVEAKNYLQVAVERVHL